MSLSAQEIAATILTLPEQEQQEVYDFVEFLKVKLVRRRAKQFLASQVTIQTEGDGKLLDKPRKLGLFKGKIKMSDDFNAPLPDSFWLEGKL